MQLVIWRPAQPFSGRAIAALDVSELIGEAPASAGPTWPRGARAQAGVGLSVFPDHGLATLSRLSAFARRGARRASGRFPLVLVGQGLFYESPFHQFVLAEYLASHGFVVATAALTGALSAAPRMMREDLEAEVRDLEFVAAHLAGDAQVDASRTAFVGWDLGGMAGLLYAARRPQLGALAAFDCGIVEQGHIRHHLNFDLNAVRTPILLATRPSAELEAIGLPEDMSLLRGLDWVERTIIRLPAMRHADFSVTGMIEGVAPGFWGVNSRESAPRIAALLELTLSFLSAHLGDDGAARAALAQNIAQLGGEHWPSERAKVAYADLAAAAFDERRIGDLQRLAAAGDARDLDVASLERLACELFYRRRLVRQAHVVVDLAQRLYPGADFLREITADVRRTQP